MIKEDHNTARFVRVAILGIGQHGRLALHACVLMTTDTLVFLYTHAVSEAVTIAAARHGGSTATRSCRIADNQVHTNHGGVRGQLAARHSLF